MSNDDRLDLLHSPNKQPCKGVTDHIKHYPHWWNNTSSRVACMGLPPTNPAEFERLQSEVKGKTSVYEVDDKYVQHMYDVTTWGQVRTPWDKLSEGERAGFTNAIKVAYREGFHVAMRNVADHVRAQQKDA